MKQVGEFNGVSVYEDPNCPPGKMYFLDDHYMNFYQVDTRSRWQRLKDWVKRIFKR